MGCTAGRTASGLAAVDCPVDWIASRLDAWLDAWNEWLSYWQRLPRASCITNTHTHTHTQLIEGRVDSIRIAAAAAGGLYEPVGSPVSMFAESLKHAKLLPQNGFPRLLNLGRHNKESGSAVSRAVSHNGELIQIDNRRSVQLPSPLPPLPPPPPPSKPANLNSSKCTFSGEKGFSGGPLKEESGEDWGRYLAAEKLGQAIGLGRTR